MKQPRPIRPRQWAGAHENSELISIDTYSGYASRVGDPSGPQYDFRPDASDEVLGAAILSCLSCSRFLDSAELRAELFHPEAVKRNYEEWINRLMQVGGYKTRRALFKQMKSCLLEREDETITIKPSHHEKLEGWSGQGFTDADDVVISAVESPAAIGAALREAFRRCT